MQFSVLIPVYKNDKANQLIDCFDSIKDQSVKADEVLVLIDGPIGDDLHKVIYESGFNFHYFEINRGLPHVLNDGIKLAKHPWIFRMDADDIALSNRFSKQVAYIESHPDVTLLGGQVQEFSDSLNNLHGVRVVPEASNNIRSFSRWRNPFNHPTVAFKKEIALKLGGYDGNAYFFEDHEFWLRFIADNQVVANLPDILVYMRIGDFFLKRRSGQKYIKHEIYFFKRMRELGIIGYPYFFLLCAIRLPLRLLPISWLKIIYKIFLRKS
jgi:glycosyltransferase involved in cell wall biosynthesis